ncbi:hypothetical protein Y032_0005g2471 [Ancylostoma ceylanicum]|uniref:Uncharacterized protein n=1 Tax=Ancylostoma ceylanicum TaxID=53326 RepID=A0A016VRF7_9BILA|nr:hypothetical protein Y032_0005g2471 [Ancylostoma ceylanicum]
MHLSKLKYLFTCNDENYGRVSKCIQLNVDFQRQNGGGWPGIGSSDICDNTRITTVVEKRDRKRNQQHISAHQR